MAVTRTSLSSVLADLRASRDQVKQDLDDFDRAISCLEMMLHRVPPEGPPPVEPVAPTTVGAAAVAPTKTPPPKATTAEEDPRPGRRATIPGIGLADAIAKVAEEARHNQTEMVRRVVELRPGTSASVASTQVSTMLKNRVLHKGPDLIIRRVVGGKIQGLPAREGEDGPLAAYGQYSSGAKE